MGTLNWIKMPRPVSAGAAFRWTDFFGTVGWKGNKNLFHSPFTSWLAPASIGRLTEQQQGRREVGQNASFTFNKTVQFNCSRIHVTVGFFWTILLGSPYSSSSSISK